MGTSRKEKKRWKSTGKRGKSRGESETENCYALLLELSELYAYSIMPTTYVYDTR